MTEITITDPVGPREIADRLQRSVNTIYSWQSRGTIIDPDIVISGVPIWSWQRVAVWALETGRPLAMKWAVMS